MEWNKLHMSAAQKIFKWEKGEEKKKKVPLIDSQVV